MTAFGDMGSQQGIRAVENGFAIGGKFRFYTGSGTPVSTFSATEIGDLYWDYTNTILYRATATGSANWIAFGSGIAWKEPVRVATVADGTLATAYANGQTVDGITLVTADRILLKNQTDQTANGIYTVNATGAPTRAMDADTGAELLGAVVTVLEGTVNEDSAWVNTNSTTITIGSSNITYAIFGGTKAGTNLAYVGDVLNVNLAAWTANRLVQVDATGAFLEVAAGAYHAQNTDTGTTATTFTVDSDSTTGKFALQAAGGGNFTLTLQTPTIAGAVAITLPAVTGTLATLDGAEAFTNKINVSITSQSSAYNNSALNVGKYGTAIADTLLADNILVSFNNSSGVNKTSADTSSMTLYVGSKTTAAVTNNKMQGILSSSNIAHNMYDAYAIQGHMGITENCGTQNANGHVTGISGKLSISSSKTLATGWGTALLGIVDGAGAVTQMCSVCSLVQEAGCSAVQDMLYINNDGTATRGINFVGNFTKGIDFSNGTFSQGYSNACIAYGTQNAAKSITPTTHVIPFQCNIISVADSGTSGDETFGAAYFKTQATTAHQPNHQLATCMVRTNVTKNIWDAYGLQSHITFGTVTMQTTGTNAHLTAISGKVSFDTTTVTKGWVTAGLFIIEGAGTCSELCYGVSIVEEAGSTGCQALLHLNTDVGTTPYFKFSGADGSGKSIYSHTAAGTQDGTIKVLINGTPKWIPFMQAE